MSLCGDDHTSMLNRIARIEGQVRGLRKMVEEDRDCMEVLKQIACRPGGLAHLRRGFAAGPFARLRGHRHPHQGHEEDLIAEVVDLFNKFSG